MEIRELNDKLNIEIKNIFLPLYNVISRDEICNLKGQLINEEIESKKFTKECEKIIDNYSLNDDEKNKWKEIYQKADNSKDLRGKLLDFFEQE